MEVHLLRQQGYVVKLLAVLQLGLIGSVYLLVVTVLLCLVAQLHMVQKQ